MWTRRRTAIPSSQTECTICMTTSSSIGTCRKMWQCGRRPVGGPVRGLACFPACTQKMPRQTYFAGGIFSSSRFQLTYDSVGRLLSGRWLFPRRSSLRVGLLQPVGQTGALGSVQGLCRRVSVPPTGKLAFCPDGFLHVFSSLGIRYAPRGLSFELCIQWEGKEARDETKQQAACYIQVSTEEQTEYSPEASGGRRVCQAARL